MELLIDLESRIKNICKKSKKIGIVITVTTHHSTKLRFLSNRNVQNFECITIVIENTKQAIDLIKKFDGKIDVFFVDIENKLARSYDLYYKISKYVKKSKIFPIKGNDFSADATFAILFQIFNGVRKKRMLIVGAGNIGSKLSLKLVESGTSVFILNSSDASTSKVAKAVNTIKPKECLDKVIPVLKKDIPLNLDCIIGYTRGIPVITEKMLKLVKKNGYVFDGGQGTITKNALNYAKANKLKIIKIDTRFGFESNASLMINSKKLVDEIMGSNTIQGITIVAGGIIGKKGDIIVDNILKPKKILGIANGSGGLIYDDKIYERKIAIIKKKYKIK